MKSVKVLLAAAVLTALAACASAALPQRPDPNRWEELSRRADLRRAEQAQARALAAQLDAEAVDAPLYRQWKTMTENPSRRLDAAWSILHRCVPRGDVSRWAEVKGFELPSETPRALMVIDALYAAVTELPGREGGAWLARDLLLQFSCSSSGRYDFLGECPAPVAEALARIKAQTGLPGAWTPRRVLGELPLARPVRGTVTTSRAQNGDMQFLDGDGLPSGSGFYAWDRAFNVSPRAPCALRRNKNAACKSAAERCAVYARRRRAEIFRSSPGGAPPVTALHNRRRGAVSSQKLRTAGAVSPWALPVFPGAKGKPRFFTWREKVFLNGARRYLRHRVKFFKLLSSH